MYCYVQYLFVNVRLLLWVFFFRKFTLVSVTLCPCYNVHRNTLTDCQNMKNKNKLIINVVCQQNLHRSVNLVIKIFVIFFFKQIDFISTKKTQLHIYDIFKIRFYMYSDYTFANLSHLKRSTLVCFIQNIFNK